VEKEVKSNKDFNRSSFLSNFGKMLTWQMVLRVLWQNCF